MLRGMLAKKYKGCLTGALLGDCFGGPFEGDLPQNISKAQLQSFFDKLEGPAYKTPLYKYSDDTAMTKSVAESLIEKNGFDPHDMAKKFITEYYKDPRRNYGANVVDVFHKLNLNLEDVWKPAKEQFGGTGSYGNGGAMRIAPVPLFAFKDYSSMLEIAENATRLTHTHRLGINGALLQAIAIHSSLNNDPDKPLDIAQFMKDLLDKITDLENKSDKVVPDSASYFVQLTKVRKLLELGENAITDVVVEELGNDVSAIYSVPTAIYCFLRAQQPIPNIETDNPFRRTLQYAISLGGDTDTIASMAGAIAGAYYGIDVINPNLINLAESQELMETLSTRLYERIS
ncbi:ADP-ribosylhydrolase ARH3-like isoform X2 [Planococcus citri]